MLDVALRGGFERLADDPPRELVIGTVVAVPEGAADTLTPQLLLNPPHVARRSTGSSRRRRSLMKGARKSDQLATLILENVQPRSGRGSWHGGPTAVGALRGVSAEQAVWTPAPGRKSIWQLALHIAYWKYAVRRGLEAGSESRFARTPANWPRVPSPADARAWSQDIALLKREHELLVDVIAAVPLSRYGVPFPRGKRWTMGEMILGIAQHDAYHTGQIQLLKRLWSTKRR